MEWLPKSSRWHPPVILLTMMNEPSKSAKFEVRKVLRMRLPRGPSIVFAGRILEGKIRPGMDVLFELQPSLYCSARITAVEFIDRVSGSVESVIGLVCSETDSKEAELYSELCPPGTIVQVNQPTGYATGRIPGHAAICNRLPLSWRYAGYGFYP